MRHLIKFIPSLLVIFLSTSKIVEMDYFTSIFDLERLIYSEREVARSLQEYVEKEENRLTKLRHMSKQFNELYQAASNMSSTEFLSNPLNAFLLVKRLTHDWKTTGSLVDDFQNKAVLEHIQHGAVELPGDEDLEGAIHALMRLHHTYRLNISDLARGQVAGAMKSFDLSASDCYDIGYYYLTSGDFKHSIAWLQEARRRLDEEDSKTEDKTKILKTLAEAAFLNENSTLAVDITVDLILEDPNNHEAYSELAKYQMHKTKQEEENITYETVNAMDEYEQIKLVDPTVADQLQEWYQYEALCREEKFKTDLELSKMKCYYETNNNMFLLLQPAKVEVVNLKPKIVMFRDIISSAEADYLKGLASPLLKRAQVQNTETNVQEEAYFRISKSAWLDNYIDPVVDRVNQRVQDWTGLTTRTAEELLVLNYGIGGHYEPHWDFSNESNAFANLGTGNRMATLIFYLSDVGAGGGTVFPRIGLNLKPMKGSAGFWYNLFQNGTGDFRTKHAACPVLSGSKWISNKWIHESGQEFRRRCSINQLE